MSYARGVATALRTVGFTKRAIYQDVFQVVDETDRAVNLRGRNLAEYQQNIERHYGNRPGVAAPLRAQAQAMGEIAPHMRGTVGPRGEARGGVVVRQGKYVPEEWRPVSTVTSGTLPPSGTPPPSPTALQPARAWWSAGDSMAGTPEGVLLNTVSPTTAAHEAGHAAQPHDLGRIGAEIDATTRATRQLTGQPRAQTRIGAQVPPDLSAAMGTYLQGRAPGNFAYNAAVEAASRRLYPDVWKRVERMQLGVPTQVEPARVLERLNDERWTKWKAETGPQLQPLFDRLQELQGRTMGQRLRPGTLYNSRARQIVNVPVESDPQLHKKLLAEHDAVAAQYEKLRDFQSLTLDSPEARKAIAAATPTPEMLARRRAAQAPGGLEDRLMERARELRRELINPVRRPELFDAMTPEERASVKTLRQQVGAGLDEGFGAGAGARANRFVNDILSRTRALPRRPVGVLPFPQVGEAAAPAWEQLVKTISKFRK